MEDRYWCKGMEKENYSKKKLNVQFILICTLIILSIIDTYTKFLNSSFVSISYIYILYPVFLYYFLVKKEALKLNDWWELLFFAGGLIGISCITNMLFHPIDFKYFIQVFNFLLFPFLGYSFAKYNPEQIRKKIYWLIVLIAFYANIVGIFQIVTGNLRNGNRTDSFMGHPIVYCTLLVTAYPLINLLFKSNLLKSIFKLFLIFGILSTQSRSGWIAWLVIIVCDYFFCVNNNKKVYSEKKIILMLFFMLMIICLLLIFHSEFCNMVNYYTNLISLRLDNTFEGIAATQREGIFLNIISSMSPIEYIVGNGYYSSHSFVNTLGIIGTGSQTTDNEYLTLIYEEGIFGLAYAIWIIRICIKGLINKSKNQELKNLSLSIMAAMVSACFYEMFSWTNISVIVLILIGILYFELKRIEATLL